MHRHYHSFPRRWRERAECNAKGLAILRSIAHSGLLLTPERVLWPKEVRTNGRTSEDLTGYHKRVCFTYLQPQELRNHADLFGPFCIEFDNWELRTLGAIPVFYVPIASDQSGFLGVGISLAHRMADFQSLLERLKTFVTVVRSANDKAADMICVPLEDGGFKLGPNSPDAKMMEFKGELLRAIKEENPDFQVPTVREPSSFGANVGSVESLLNILTWGIQSYEIQHGAIQALSGYFYPSERFGKDDLLSYYQQREWRILDSLQKNGTRASRQLAEREKRLLLELDAEFFGGVLSLRDGTNPRLVDECAYLREVEGRNVLAYARRLICPQATAGEARKILRAAGHGHMDVHELESAQDFN